MDNNGTSTLFNDNGDTSRYQSREHKTDANNIGGYTGLNLNWNISDKTNLSTWFGMYPYWGRNHSDINLQYMEYFPSRRDLGYHYTMDNGDGFGIETDQDVKCIIFRIFVINVLIYKNTGSEGA